MAWCALSLIEVAHDVLHYLWPNSDVLYYGVIVLKVCKFSQGSASKRMYYELQYTKPASLCITNAVTYLLLFALLEMTISALYSFCWQHKQVNDNITFISTPVFLQSCCCCATPGTRVPATIVVGLAAAAITCDHFWIMREVVDAPLPGSDGNRICVEVCCVLFTKELMTTSLLQGVQQVLRARSFDANNRKLIIKGVDLTWRELQVG